MLRRMCQLLAIGLVLTSTLAASEPSLTLLWPSDKPAIKFVFGKFRQIGVIGGQTTFVSEVLVENLTAKAIPNASFAVHLLDNENVRVGDGILLVSDLQPGQRVKVQFEFSTLGEPVTLTLSAKNDPLALEKSIPLKIVSVPAGAKLKVDGADSGLTPVTVKFSVGTHTLELTKEGYAPSSTPVDINADELPGGSISVELGGLSRDTLELRDGTVLLGDVMSMSMTGVVIRVDGKDQTYARNLVKKILLVEREMSQQPPVLQPAHSATPK